MRIFEGTLDWSDYLFPEKLPLLIELDGGFAQLWARWESEDSIRLLADTPEKFFDDLIRVIEAVEC